tara:strand:- start:116 stop:451 length:336 start_codon:yes stop_codon:yes gene_type:complete
MEAFLGFYTAIAIPWLLWKNSIITSNTTPWLFIGLGFYFGLTWLFFNGWIVAIENELLSNTILLFYIVSSLTWLLWGWYVQDEDPTYFWIAGPLFGAVALWMGISDLISWF